MEDKTELMTIDNICNRVYNIRGQQVMLDYDLAEIYGYKVKNLNQQVKRNVTRFPEDFMFQLTRNEMESVKSQFVISRDSNLFEGQGGGRRTLPYAFTEQGIYMLATVLRGELAEQQSIFIMRAFREMRHYIKQNQQFVTQAEMRLVKRISSNTRGAFMKYLFTAFKGKNNSSYQLVSQIAGEKMFLTNSFEGLKRDIENCLDTYDMVVMFGLDKNLKDKVRVERIAEYENLTEDTKIDIEKIKKSLIENRVGCVISDTPTKYLCNAAYFHMLQKMGGKAVFIHIPSLKNMSEDMIEKIINCVEKMKDNIV